MLACLLTAAIGLGFTENRVPQPDESDESPGYAATLRAGLAEARSSRAVRRLLLLVPALAAVWGGLAEYDPLLAADTGVSVETIPLLVLLLWAGVTVGGLLTPIGRRMPPKVFTGTLAAAARALARSGWCTATDGEGGFPPVEREESPLHHLQSPRSPPAHSVVTPGRPLSSRSGPRAG